MNDNYLETFKDIFFDVNKSPQVKKAVNQACYVISSIIYKFGQINNEISSNSSEQNNFTDLLICMFVRKIMEQLDAINVLFSVGLFTQAQIILRSLIENIISFEFILEEDTDKRAAAYFLEHHYQEIELATKYYDKNSTYFKSIIESDEKEQFENNLKKYTQKKEALKRLIESNEIFKEVDKTRKKKIDKKIKTNNSRKNVYIQWYEVCSTISNFYGLMKKMGYEKSYHAIYGGLSNETHALNTTMEMKVDNDGFILKWIRSPEEGSSIFEIACSFSISALKKIYIYLNYENNQKAVFKKFYDEFKIKRDIASHNLDMLISSK